MTRSLRFLLLAALAAACDPYSPDLGQTPFRCQPEDPEDPDKERCPEGYKPVVVPAPIGCECQKPNPDTPDAGGAADTGMFACDNDPNEPNESIAMATPTLVAGGSTSQVFSGVAICPDGTDVDVYSMSMGAGQVGQTLTARINFNAAEGDLQLSILNSGGNVVAGGMAQVNQVTASYPIPATGTYYARVQSSGGARNNYTLQLSVAP